MCCGGLCRWLLQLVRRCLFGYRRAAQQQQQLRRRDDDDDGDLAAQQERLLAPGLLASAALEAPAQQSIAAAAALKQEQELQQQQQQQQAATPAAAAAAAASLPSPVPGDKPLTTLIVMRHGHRQDEEDPCWHSTARRPWDPPLSAKGKQQAAAAAAAMARLGVDVVVSSPFRRCLQTAAGVVRGLAVLNGEDGGAGGGNGGLLPDGRWLVDWALAEVCEPRVLFTSRADARARVGDRPLEAWMWGGGGSDARGSSGGSGGAGNNNNNNNNSSSSDDGAGDALAAALRRFVADDCRLAGVPIAPRPRPGGGAPPLYPESLEQGLRRYSLALRALGRAYPGATVLVVTHGECVRQAVALAEPRSEVFEVQHAGYVVLRQQRPAAAGAAGAGAGAAGGGGGPAAGDGGGGGWELASESGETGVLWLEDDD